MACSPTLVDPRHRLDVTSPLVPKSFALEVLRLAGASDLNTSTYILPEPPKVSQISPGEATDDRFVTRTFAPLFSLIGSVSIPSV